MRGLFTVLALIVLGVSLAAQKPDLSRLRPTPDEPIPAMRFVNADLRDVLNLIAEGRGLKIEFAPDVAARTKIGSFALNNAKTIQAIALVLEVAHVDAVVVNETTLRVVSKP
jgi:hypothetical protein